MRVNDITKEAFKVLVISGTVGEGVSNKLTRKVSMYKMLEN